MTSLKFLILSMRPKQWSKNLIVYLPLIFSVNLYWKLDIAHLAGLLGATTAAFALFCFITSGVYLINDLTDIESDREHPEKRNRPLASGKLSPALAKGAAAIVLALSLPLGFWLDTTFGIMGAIYLALMLAYSFYLKHIVIVDVFVIALGFVLRAAAGAMVISVPISPWLYILTFLGALFLGFGKRRHELLVLNDNASSHRSVLHEYTPQLLEEMISVVTPSTVIAYSLYTFSAQNLPSNHAMMLTVPFAFYGIFRYLYLVHSKNLGGSPEEVLLNDAPLVISIFLWLATAVAVLLAFRGG